MCAPEVDLDALVEAAALAGLAGTVPTVWLVAQNPRLAAVATAAGDAGRERGPKALPWSPAEDDFLRANLGFLSDEDMGHELGRTRVAVHLHWKRDLRLPTPTKDPGWITPNRVAWSLHIDGHCVMRLVRDGVLPAEPLPWRNHGIYSTFRLRVVTFYRWAVNPRNWVYFRLERVRDPHLRRLLQLKAARWGDAWLTPGEVAAMHGVKHQDVNRYIRAGKLPAVRWNNWRILRSDAERAVFFQGRGAGREVTWNPDLDAFLLLARAIGLSISTIARVVSMSSATVSFRLRDLLANPAAACQLARAYDSPVQISADGGDLFADWRLYRRRFPFVARAMDRCAAGRTLQPAERAVVRGVLAAWANWHADTTERRRFAHNLAHASNLTPARLAAGVSEMRTWGLEPLL